MPKHPNKTTDNTGTEMLGFLDAMLAETKAVGELKKEIASLQKDVSELVLKNQELSSRIEENEDTILRLKAAYNKMLSDASSFEANTIIFSRKREPESLPLSSRASDGILLFEGLRQKIDNFCSDSLLANADSLSDEYYYRFVAGFYRSMYQRLADEESEDTILEGLLEQFWLQKEASLASGIYEKLKDLVCAAQKSWQDIFGAQAANQYPRYELVYPEAGSPVNSEYEFIKEDKNPHRKIVSFCIYPGILEISHNNDTNQDKILWRAKPVVWSDRKDIAESGT